jgi:hypothetical protein
MSRTCDHAVVEQFIENTPRQMRQRILAVCSGCGSVATRLWLTPLGDKLGWVWPDQEEAFQKWKRRGRA